ncbi:MAG: metallophosphoesterase family protein [Thermoplasmata archaeon]
MTLMDFRNENKKLGVSSLQPILYQSTKNLRSAKPRIPEKGRVRFVHLADLHLGSFRIERKELQQIPLRIFRMVIEFSKKYNVDFVVIAGDLFDSNVTSIECLKETGRILADAKEHGIRVYSVPGSHDASPTHSAYIDVLASANLIQIVEKLVQNEEGKIQIKPVQDKTGINIVGLGGLKRGNEIEYYKNLDYDTIEKIPKPRIFIMHSTITEFRPDFLREEQGIPLSLIPRDFSYYACGHVHQRLQQLCDGYGIFVYPGQLFAATIRDFEHCTNSLPGFYLVDFDEHMQVSEQSITFVDVYSLQTLVGEPENMIPDVLFAKISFEEFSPSELEYKLKNILKNSLKSQGLQNCILLLKMEGKLREGRRCEIRWQELAKDCIESGAVEVFFNKEKIEEKEVGMEIIHGETTEEIEKNTMIEFFLKREGASNREAALEKAEKAMELLPILAKIQEEGEKEDVYINRIYEEVIECLERRSANADKTH